jgi:hypothetical protein
MIKYYLLGADKRLCDIVIAGSHDAGITKGKDNVQTQDQDIGGQANDGVRIFDLRIAAEKLTVNHGLGKEVELRAFHADSKLMSNKTTTRYVPALNRNEVVTQTKLRGGAFGLGLSAMLQSAKTFVTTNTDEFLILKFDKSSNWRLIAETCVKELGASIYKGQGNLNLKTLRDLRGKVIVLFTSAGVAEVALTHPPGSGILGIKNLFSKEAPGVYDPLYNGMQYFGKGGTSVSNPWGKIAENEEKQSKLMKKGGDGNPNVIGMMYWTTTGVSESIAARNNKMWTGSNITALRAMWTNGLQESIQSRIAKTVDPATHAAGGVLKAFMPNIVMVDFADTHKCRIIHELNAVGSNALVQASTALDSEVALLRRKHAASPNRRDPLPAFRP